jgi:hypothetical protein
MKKVDRSVIDMYRMTEEKEAVLWKNGIVVFDSCAILDFYYIPKNMRSEIYTDIFKRLKNRLWIPFHVQYEYLKNRTKVLKKPVSKNYTPIRKTINELQKDIKSSVLKKVDSIQQDTKNNDRHPHIDQSKIEAFKILINDFLSETAKFETDVLKEIKSIEEDILSVEKNDDVLKALETNFETGREYSYNEIISLTKEGKHRYEYKIPPGYGDLESKEKKGTQIFGDLIIWKQILEYSKQQQQPIIFITNDIKKNEDWCYLDPSSKEDRILMPREELIKEIRDHSNVDFWMYNFSQFLYHAKTHLKATMTDKYIQNISELLNERDDVYLRYYQAEIIVLKWLKENNEGRNILEDSPHADFIIEYSDHKEGIEVKLMTGRVRSNILIRKFYDKASKCKAVGWFDNFTGILIVENEKEGAYINEYIHDLKQKKPNEFVSFIIGCINENNEFVSEFYCA